jgi:hypothetical protein
MAYLVYKIVSEDTCMYVYMHASSFACQLQLGTVDVWQYGKIHLTTLVRENKTHEGECRC